MITFVMTPAQFMDAARSISEMGAAAKALLGQGTPRSEA
jgi:hypothetical protein